MRILNAVQMREADRRTIEEIGIPSIVLMENAGRTVVAAMESAFSELLKYRIAIVCGHGNNGGDGFVVARTLLQRGLDINVLLLGQTADVVGDARANLDVLARLGQEIIEIGDLEAWNRHRPEVANVDLIVDAILGTGLNRPLRGLVATVVSGINNIGLPVVSLDLPTGLSADRAEPTGGCIKAKLTVTFDAPKVPLVLAPATSYVGDLVVADIGIPNEVIKTLDGPWLELITREYLRPLIPDRKAGAHKGDFGRVVVVAGSIGKTGAARLAGLGALRSGAGLVTIATPATCVRTVATVPEYMTHPLTETSVGTVDASAVDDVLALNCDVLAVGPGLGLGTGPQEFVRTLVKQVTGSLVLDADALNAYADEPDALDGTLQSNFIITPHPGEMARLIGTTTDEVQRTRVDTARTFATEHKLHVVLKGAQTVIATPKGKVFVNSTGNPGMATGGTGDVLTGVIAAWLGQLKDAEAACIVGVYLHGLAGDLAAQVLGEPALTATDVIGRLGAAVNEILQKKS